MQLVESQCEIQCQCGWSEAMKSAWDAVSREKYVEAELLVERALSIAKANQSADQLFYVYAVYASLMSLTKREDEAEKGFKNGLLYSNSIKSEDEFSYMTMLLDFGFFLYRRKRVAEARPLFAAATAIAVRTREFDRISLPAMAALTVCHIISGNIDLARQSCSQALKEHFRKYGPGDQRTRQLRDLKSFIAEIADSGIPGSKIFFAMDDKTGIETFYVHEMEGAVSASVEVDGSLTVLSPVQGRHLEFSLS